ncbi:hypothetical protein A3A14_03495 [Candidatus Daviesbacteria bacterium RIFCSPLOWO2_01_FULL_43_38]|uniref:Uncharacterized protein n=3 Tax=Candidatus Daviesiibacteriota TaxID=1752718 RepID=A0A1F5K767_9BACT|nr:MAG: hypothetical protein UV33_C0001G0026 [Candidatus Daviesbacteria bacterium GW2011_GWA1_42_6]KKS70850.1 MAG: hypothetical protein UV41_C0011G0012 [Candidatus Daviesbacteria bacterium GW2011_GWA2_42_7]OGE20643.1 MAG: hypothetical protein A2874_02120 [Candidatus Daviesbacteria bacterium RIFCSPHIGHO2_01_FULL_43_17]OGE36787.1 MAG: hypothetical protein A3E45_01540 [Candidatus Daviesbacteria bacterium RIFCSPHIGHO2_12_FULL_43_11]OGE63705.1 MAG: hypothetical protein A3A14_03495 [Candidatus Davies
METEGVLNKFELLVGIWFLIEGLGMMHPKTRVWLIKLHNMFAGRATEITSTTTVWQVLRGVAYILVGSLLLYNNLILQTPLFIK